MISSVLIPSTSGLVAVLRAMKDQPAAVTTGSPGRGVTGVGPGVAQRGGEGAGAESLAGTGRAEPAVQGRHQQMVGTSRVG